MLGRLVMLMAVFVATTTLAAETPSPLNLTTQEKAWLAAHPVIRLGVDPGYAPYAFIDAQGRPAGISAELTALVALCVIAVISWSATSAGVAPPLLLPISFR